MESRKTVALHSMRLIKIYPQKMQKISLKIKAHQPKILS